MQRPRSARRPDIDSPSSGLGPELEQLYDRIARILGIGFWTSIGVILLGVILTLAQGDDLGDETFHMEDVIPELLDGEAQALVDLGILLLLLTPLAYVVAALFTFLRQRDQLFVGVCGALLLLFGITIGVALW